MNRRSPSSPIGNEGERRVVERGERATSAIMAVDWTNGGAQLSITDVNAAFTRTFGYSREESITRSPTMLCGPRTDLHALKKGLEAVLRDGSATFRTIHYHKDGTPIELELSIVPVIDASGTVTGTLSSFRELLEPIAPTRTDREVQRLAALRSYNILDTQPEPEYDAITALIAKLCQVPIALVSLIDEDRQWFKSNCGLAARDSTGRDVAFCSHAIEQASIMVINDTSLDRRFANNPLVIGEPYLRFYAGAPLIDADGMALGTLCIADYVPRELTIEQWSNLGRLARSVTNLIVARRRN